MIKCKMFNPVFTCMNSVAIEVIPIANTICGCVSEFLCYCINVQNLVDKIERKLNQYRVSQVPQYLIPFEIRYKLNNVWQKLVNCDSNVLNRIIKFGLHLKHCNRLNPIHFQVIGKSLEGKKPSCLFKKNATQIMFSNA